MAENSKIQWCDDTANFWRGCTKVSPGCANCYAEKNVGVKMQGIKWGKGQPRVKSKSAVADCLRWNKSPFICNGCGNALGGVTDIHEADLICSNCDWQGFHRRRVFSLSLGDWLDPEVPIEWLAEMLDTIRRCDQLIFILCTKRPELFRERLQKCWKFKFGYNYEALSAWVSAWECGKKIPTNVWLLTSVENQEMADKRIPELQKIPAVVRGLSLEPLLGAVELNALFDGQIHYSALQCGVLVKEKLDWLIIGGESGPKSRPCNVEWIRSLVQQGHAAGVATFVKQLGSNAFEILPNGSSSFIDNLRHPKGGDSSEWSEDLRIREFPTL